MVEESKISIKTKEKEVELKMMSRDIRYSISLLYSWSLEDFQEADAREKIIALMRVLADTTIPLAHLYDLIFPESEELYGR